MDPDGLRQTRRVPLFRDMLPENFEALMVSADAIACRPGEKLLRQGAIADRLHVVLAGSVELYAEWEGRKSTMAIVAPAGTFILAACVRNAPYLMSARALGDTRIVRVPAADLRAVLRHDPDFAISVTQELAGAYRTVVRHSRRLKLRAARQRLAAYLLQESRRAGDVDSYDLFVEKRLLASLLDVKPETLSRALKSLQDDGVAMDGARVIITDRSKLVALVEPQGLTEVPKPQGATGLGR